MTRKDYVKFAAMLKRIRAIPGSDKLTISRAVQAMADLLADDNPNFDRARFLAACGVES